MPAIGYLDRAGAELLRAAGAPPPAVSSIPSPPPPSAEPATSERPPIPEPVASSAGAAVDCTEWNTRDFFETATDSTVTACLAAGADVAARDGARNTPLHWAAGSSSDPAVIETLLEAGGQLEARNDDESTPLQHAARNNENPAVVEALLSAGADLTIRSSDGSMLVHLAAQHNSNATVAQALAAAEAVVRPDRRSDHAVARPPRHAAANSGQLPPDILLDSYLLRAEQSVRDGDVSGARAAIRQLLALQAEHDLVVAAEYHYRYARVWNALEAWDRALVSVRRYLQLTGRNGSHYLDALAVMNRATVALEEANRERDRLAAEEARRRAAAERARAAVERKLSAAREVLDRMEFARVPAGQFMMSPSAQRNNWERRPNAHYRRREVRITQPFEIGRYEVTQSEWLPVMGRPPTLP